MNQRLRSYANFEANGDYLCSLLNDNDKRRLPMSCDVRKRGDYPCSLKAKMNRIKNYFVKLSLVPSGQVVIT